MTLAFSPVYIKMINLEKKKVIGIEIELPDAPPLILIRGDKGFVMCGYLNIDVAEKLGILAIRVSGVKNIDEMLEKTISEVTTKAMELGIKPGMKVKDILPFL